MEQIHEKFRLEIDVLSQPNDTTCGPTALHAVYRYYDDFIPLEQVVREVHTFEDGGTLAVWLGCHALKRGYDATLYTCNVQLLDPTWFSLPHINLIDKLQQQAAAKKNDKLIRSSHAVIDFLEHGGHIKLVDVTRDLLRKCLREGHPILTGLSSTFLYRVAREVPENNTNDDIRGQPAGHFVILCGYDSNKKQISIADPLSQNPFSPARKYEIHIDRVICAILLGVLTYDANFLVIKPKKRTKKAHLVTHSL